MDLNRKFIDNKLLTKDQIKENIFYARNEVALVLTTMNQIEDFYEGIPDLADKDFLESYKKEKPLNTSFGLASFSKIEDEALPLFYRAAIGLNYLSGEYGLNENSALGKLVSDDPFEFLEFNAYGTIYTDGFRKACVGVLSSCLTHAEQTKDKFLVNSIKKDIKAISFDDENAKAHPPKWLAHKRVLGEEEAVQKANEELFRKDINARPYDMRPQWVAKMGLCVGIVSSLRVTNEARALIKPPQPK